MKNKLSVPLLTVLGIAQDGGVPHSGCYQECCRDAWLHSSAQKLVSCLGIIDPISQERWMIDATPDFKFQLRSLHNQLPFVSEKLLDGIFLTHGHIGHYTGILNLDKAIMNSKNIPVFAMPKMSQFLRDNFPWKGLLENHNIDLYNMSDNVSYALNNRISIMPFLVPHRDEYTETVGFQILGPNKKVLYIPDIDRWEQFEKIDSLIQDCDIVLVDGTFFSGNELLGRDMSKIPHPTIESSLLRFSKLPESKKSQFYFIHLNHTNPCLNPNSKEYELVNKRGFRIAKEGETFNI